MKNQIYIEKRNWERKGFTLIETLVYLALLGIMFAGLFGAVFGVIQSAANDETKVLLQEEGNFLRAKIDWAMAGANSVSVVASPASLTINRAGIPGLIVLKAVGDNLEIEEGGGSIALNNSWTKAKDLIFTRHGVGSGEESIEFKFTLQANDRNGRLVSQDFTITKYLRR